MQSTMFKHPGLLQIWLANWTV